jgi:hypothetical protein
MVAVAGIYQNGQIKLDKDYPSKHPVKVIVTFLEELPKETEKALSLSDFSFLKSREILKDLKSSLSDEVIAERRREL